MTEPEINDGVEGKGARFIQAILIPSVGQGEWAPAMRAQFALMRKRWLLVLILFLAGATVAYTASFLRPRIYRGEAVVEAISDREGATILGQLGDQLGGLASLAGINLSSSGTSSAPVIALLKSRSFIEKFIAEKNLLPILFAARWDRETKRWKAGIFGGQPTLQDGFDLFSRSVFRVSEDRKTGLITVRVDWRDPEYAAQWTNELVARANTVIRELAIREATTNIEYLNRELARTTVVELREAIYSLIESQIKKRMFANARPDFAFRVIDPAKRSDADKYVRPDRALSAGAGAAVGMILGMILAVTARRPGSPIPAKSAFQS